MNNGALASGPAVRSALPLQCSFCQFRKATKWADLGSDETRILDQARRVYACRRGDTVFLQGDEPQGIYCVESGYILLWQSDYFGNETAFGLVGPGDSMGYRSFFAEDQHAATARAVTPCKVCLIPGAAIRTLLARNPRLAERFLRLVARDRGPSDAILLRGQHSPLRVRLVHLLLTLVEKCQTNESGDGIAFEVPLSRRDMAAMIGVRPETLTRAIGDMEDEGIATFEGRRVSIRKMDRLREIVGREKPT